MNKQLEQLQAAIVALGDKMESMRHENRALQQQLSHLQTEKKQIKQEVEQIIARYQEEIKRTHASCDEKINTQKITLQKMQEQHDEQNAKLQQEKQHLREILSQGATVFAQLLGEMAKEEEASS